MRSTHRDIKRLQDSVVFLKERVTFLERKAEYGHLIGKRVLDTSAYIYISLVAPGGGYWKPCDPVCGELINITHASFLIRVGSGGDGLRYADDIIALEEICDEA